MKTFYIRTASAVVFLIVMVGGILIPLPAVFSVLMIVIAAGSTQEYLNIIAPKYKTNRFVLHRLFYVAPIFIPQLAFHNEYRPVPDLSSVDTLILSSLVITIFAFLIFAVELFDDSQNSFEVIGYKLIPLFWITVPCQLILLIFYDKGSWLVLSIFSIIWFYDSACYIVGSLIGKHKMMERVSPKKTWEGLAGGVVLTLIGAFFINKIPMLQMYLWWQWMILALVIIIAATFGDLVESLFKRGFGIKDSGTMMPGHGGYLDRFDASFFAVPFASLAIFLLDKFK